MLECRLTQGFGNNANNSYAAAKLKGHPGIDEACGYGSDVHSYVDGFVYTTYTPERPAADGYTGVYVICHTPLETFEFCTGHLSEVCVKPGDTISKGQLIGKEGNKGTVFVGQTQITLEMQAAGDTRGTHRHVQKRVVVPQQSTGGKMFLQGVNGLYQEPNGDYLVAYDYNNGYAGCVDWTAPLFNRNLFVGMRGYDVYLLQKAIGNAPENCTGYFGTLTLAAVIKFQRLNKISPALGFVGTLTRAFLNQKYKQL